MTAHPPYYENILNAFVWGSVQTTRTVEETLNEAASRGLKVDKFKRRSILPRVVKVMDWVRGMDPLPVNVLDIGCGRGTAMWPMLETFPGVRFTGVDIYEGRSLDLRKLRDAGVSSIVEGYHTGAEALTGIQPKFYDISLMLEVLEHLETDKDVEKAVREAVRVSKRFVMISVPSVKDWNPDHKRLFTARSLKNLWLRAGARKIEIEEVPKHFVARITLA